MPLIIPANSAVGGGFNVDNSLRFNDGSSDYLSRTFSSETNRKTYTISVWVKRSSTADESFIMAADASAGGGNTRDFIRIEGTDQLRYTIGGGGAADIKTTQLFRDVSAWYHIVVAVDTTQGTASNRVKIYVNGLQVTNFATSSYPSQNAVGDFNDNILHRIGMDTNNTSNGWSGYMSEFVFIDGQQLAADQFGEFDEDSGIWKPIDVSGLTFGTNGFYLDFEDSGALGDDVSGNGNDFTVNNLTAIDQTTDTPTNNFATWNSLYAYGNQTITEGNLRLATGTSGASVGTIAVNTGKWFWEQKCISIVNDFRIMGISKLVAGTSLYDTSVYYRSSAQKAINNIASSYGATLANNDIVGLAVDVDAKTIIFYKNGTSQGSIDISSVYSTGDYIIPALPQSGGATQTVDINFGSPPFTISSGNTDGNGYGNFEYAVPSGYYALNTKNLAEYG